MRWSVSAARGGREEVEGRREGPRPSLCGRRVIDRYLQAGGAPECLQGLSAPPPAPPS